jgi:undecaprenyl-diphosphatase
MPNPLSAGKARRPARQDGQQDETTGKTNTVSLTHTIILAIIQGIAEFLPISSSGHLVIAAALLANNQVAQFDVTDVNIVLHAGTLLSIIVIYWHRIWRLAGEDIRTIPLLIVGTIPVVIVGFTAKSLFEPLLANALLAGGMLIINGAILLITSGIPHGDCRYQEMGMMRALWIGLAQSFAILPGISRSGTTICTGLFAGLSRQDAATFSFLLAIPAIGGASTLEIVHLIKDAELTTPILNLVVGAMIAFVVGLGSLSWLIRWLEKGRLQHFAYWCLLVGAGVVVWQLVTK